MSRVCICICDENKKYLELVQRYLLKKKTNNISIQVFTEINRAIDYSFKDTFEVCLINESLLCENVNEIKTNKIWILQETKTGSFEYPSISKFQSMDKILDKILEEIPVNEDEKIEGNTKIITFFETQKFQNELNGLSLSKHLTAFGKKVLYLNLSPFTKFDFLIDTSAYDVTDLIYYLLKDSMLASKKLEIMKSEINGVSYLLPAFDYTDLLELTKEDWKEILTNLKNLIGYDFVVIEVNSANRGLLEIMDFSLRLYMNKKDKGLDGFRGLLEKKGIDAKRKLFVYEGNDFEYWKGKLKEDGILR